MKLVKYLAIGTAIAVAAALGICYAVWSFHSLHRLIWFFIVFVICTLIAQYLSGPDWKMCDNPKGKTDHEKVRLRKLTKGEQVSLVIKTVIGCIILGALVWAIGYGVACLFGWQPDLWEMHLLYGAGALAVVCLVFYAICSAWSFIGDVIHNRYFARDKVKSVLMWTVVIICSLAVAGVILYYLFPWALAN